MSLRRILALVLTISMVHVMLVSSDLVCAKHHGGAVPVGAVAQTGDDAASGHHHEPPGKDSERPCDSPASKDCCQAVASCAITLGFVATHATSEFPLSALAVAAPAEDAPAYLIRAPEPPPPKA